jgi:NAD(P)-dependent dehydrogenase (short-subunit alcohol dehydrogenase family)
MTTLGRLDLSGKVAIVTGGASGIGEDSVRLLAERGARVLVADRNEEGAAAVATDVGDVARPFCMDVTRPDECAALVLATLEAFGRLDVAVNCAGVVDGEGVPPAQTTVEQWRRILATNLDGVFYCMRAEIPPMLEAGKGSIINIGSIHSVTGIAGAAAYTSSKHGVLGLTRAAALAYAEQGIRVNCIGPGNMDTPMSRRAFSRPGGEQGRDHVLSLQAMRRLGEAWEVAEMVALLASDAASFCTGAWFGVDGGYTAR